MKILHISTGVQRIPVDKAGSPEGHIFSMSKQLSKMGHQVTVLDRKHSPTDPSFEQIDGVDIVRLSVKHLPPSALESKVRFLYWMRSGLNTALFAFKADKYLRQATEFDSINTYVISVAFLLLILNEGLRDRSFYNHHAAFWPSQCRGLSNRLLLLLGSFTMKRVKKTVVQNDSVRSQFIARLGLPEQYFVTLLPGIDTNLFSSDVEVNGIRTKYQLDGKKVILFVGRINQMKGLEYLVMAANMVVNRHDHKDVIFVLVGPFESVELDKPGEYTTRLLNLIRSFKLEQNMKLTGTVPLDSLRKLYSACDIYVLPSVVEQFSVTVIEAMAFGKPVIATKTPGALMQVRQGWNGFLVEIGNERELADRIRYLLDRPEEAKRMGMNATAFAKQFDWSIIARKYLREYAA